jgi:hypothetical protein
VIYFSLTWYFFPAFYTTQPYIAGGVPVLTQVNFSSSEVRAGSPFNLVVTGFNRGEATDIEIVSISFPNLTGDIRFSERNHKSGHVEVEKHNFTQSPLIVMPGDITGSRYSGGSETTTAKYPSIEFFSRPWKSDTGYQAILEISSGSEGRFSIFVKAISFPHIDEYSHYPHEGLKDYQEEFVGVYSINVMDKN